MPYDGYTDAIISFVCIRTAFLDVAFALKSEQLQISPAASPEM